MTRANRPTAQGLRKVQDRQRVLECVLSAGMVGIRMSNLVRDLGLSSSCIQYRLAELSEAGQVECSAATGNACRWGPPGIWAHHQGSRDRAAARREERRTGVAYEEPDIIHRIVPAAEARPLKVRPVSGVWEYAQRMAGD